MDLDDTVCYCFHVSKRKVVAFVRRERPRRASQISECLSAGTGCGWCIPFLKRFHQEGLASGEIVEACDIDPGRYEAMRREYLRTGERPPAAGGA